MVGVGVGGVFRIPRYLTFFFVMSMSVCMCVFRKKHSMDEWNWFVLLFYMTAMDTWVCGFYER